MLDMLSLDCAIALSTSEQVENLLAGVDGAAAKVLEKALNAGMATARDLMARRASERTGIGAKVIKERVWGKRATVAEPWSRARAGKIGWPLGRFPYTQEAGGVRVDLPGGSYLFPHTFVATMPGSQESVFRRDPAHMGSKMKGIVRARTDAVTDVIERISAEPEIEEAGRAAAMETLDVETKKVLASLTGGAT
ncbi:MAG: hypothetical protein ABSA67_10280 [Candidatus Brocadiia bacterium]